MFWVIGAAVSGFSLGYLKLWAFPEREHLTNELRWVEGEFNNFLTPIFSVRNSRSSITYQWKKLCTMGQTSTSAMRSANARDPQLTGSCSSFWLVVWYVIYKETENLYTFVQVNSVIIMSYCGFCCCKKLRENRKHASCRTADLQNQLMIALIVQVCTYNEF